jgi:hypothetical protein
MVNKITTWTQNFSDIEQPTDWISQINTNLNQLLGVSILMAVFFVVLLLLSNVSDFKKAFLSASFSSGLVAWLFWIINWISTWWLVVFILMTLGGLVAVYKSND